MLSLATPETISPPNPIRESFSSRIRWPHNCMNSPGDELPKEEVIDHHDHALRQISKPRFEEYCDTSKKSKSFRCELFLHVLQIIIVLMCRAIVHVSDYQACAKGEVSKLNFMCQKGRLQMKNSCGTSTFVQSGHRPQDYCIFIVSLLPL